MSEQGQTRKQPISASRVYPLRCPTCAKKQVFPNVIDYEATRRHDGRTYTFTIPKLPIAICSACGEKVFTEEVLERIHDEFRKHLAICKDYCSGREAEHLVTEEILAQLPDFTADELTCASYVIVAQKRP